MSWAAFRSRWNTLELTSRPGRVPLKIIWNVFAIVARSFWSISNHLPSIRLPLQPHGKSLSSRSSKESPEAADLMKLLAYFAPDDFPRDALCQGALTFRNLLADAVCDRVRLDDILAVLRSYSLADVQPDGVSVHRLVQAVTRDRMNDEEKEIWAAVGVKLLKRHIPLR